MEAVEAGKISLCMQMKNPNLWSLFLFIVSFWYLLQISAASLGAPTQLLSSLAATPVIANTIPSVQGITGQILTNAQGQVSAVSIPETELMDSVGRA